MVVVFGQHGDTGRRSLRMWVRQWALWALPRPALLFLLAVELLVAGCTAIGLAHANPASSDLTRFALLACLSAALGFLTDRIEQSHRSLATGPTVDTTSVWVFAGVLLLPAGYASLLVGTVYALTMIRNRKRSSWHPHRVAFTAAAMMLSALAAGAVADEVGTVQHLPDGVAPALGVILALVAFRIVNDALIAVVMYLAVGPPRIRDVLLAPDEFAVETATLVLGAFTAQTVIRMPWLTPAVLLLIVIMYRGLLVKKLEVAAATDGKTGLLNATAWRELAQRHLWRAAREDQSAAALVVDLDRFKALNDQHGHLAGDVVLREVADCLSHELRDYDAVGRYGGEEFVALLPNVDADAALLIAERVRERIESLAVAVDDSHVVRLTASLGAAAYPEHGAELDELIRAADAALYAAKATGRNAVRLAEAPAQPPSHASQAARRTPA